MFEVWVDAARDFQQQLRIPIDDAERAHSIVLGAMGPQWLETQAVRMGRPHLGFEDVHPLMRSLRSGAMEGVLHVCELAGYLTYFMRTPKLADVLASLRDHGKYESTFFELAIAWRLARAGFPVDFYPRTPRGEADMRISYIDTFAIVEVSVFPGDVFERPAIALANFLMGVVSRAVEPLEIPGYIAVEVSIDVEPDGNFRGELQRTVGDAIRRFAAAPSSAAKGSESTVFGSVFVRPVAAGEGPYAGDSSVSVCVQSIPRPEYGSLHGLQFDPRSRDTHWLHLAYDDSPTAQHRRIEKKLKRENAQLSGVTEPRLIVLDVSALGLGVLSIDAGETAATLARFESQHDSVSEIWLLTRVWSADGSRWVYRGVAHRNPNATRQLPDDVAKRVLADLDVLS